MYHILFNPHSGNGCAEEEAKLLSALYDSETSYYDITAIGSYADFFAGLAEGDSVILCGGDGTLNRFVNDTEGIEFNCDILYFAIGSGNDFLRDVEKTDKVPFRINEYIENLPTVEVDGKRYRFINNVGFGIDGYCCEVGDAIKANNEKTGKSKAVNYTAIAIKGLLFHYKPTSATVTVDSKEYRYEKVWLSPTMKGRFYGGGMMPTPAQDRMNENGELSLMLMHGTGKLKTLLVFPSLFKGEHIKHEKLVAIHTGKDISVTFDRPTAVQIDGETILGVTSYRAYAKVEAPVKA
ncbi:MAG: diacylglycerol kinase family protein [Clostridia bacterium]|nr:diacylglycerol kinase family protein [Clostridia bacterium]